VVPVLLCAVASARRTSRGVSAAAPTAQHAVTRTAAAHLCQTSGESVRLSQALTGARASSPWQVPDEPRHHRRRARRARVIYECPNCGTRYLNDRRCPDCNLFCRRIDTGGHCPYCDEPVAISDLTEPTSQAVTMTH